MKTNTTSITKYLIANSSEDISVKNFLDDVKMQNKEAILELFNFINNSISGYEENSNMASLILKASHLIKETLYETEFSEEEIELFKKKATKIKHRLELLKDVEKTKSRKHHINKSITLMEKYQFRLDRSNEASFPIIKQYIKNKVSIDYIIEITEKYPHCFEEVVNGITIYDYILDEFLKCFPIEPYSYEPYYLFKLIKIFKDKAVILGENYIKRINKLTYRKLSKTDSVLLKELEGILNETKYSLTEEEILNKYGKKQYKPITEGDFQDTFISTSSREEERMVITLDPSLNSLKDDAISVVRDGNDYILGIHITSVANRIPENGLVDKIARQNFKTYYEGPIKSIDMIDPKFNYALFSLDEGKTKPALSLYIRFSNDGTIKEYYFDFDQIHIDRSLTYETADEILTKATDADLYKIISTLTDLTQIIQQNNSGQSQSYREIKGILRPVSYDDYSSNSQSIIAEAMVLYNHLMAKKFQENPNLPFIFRIHTKPSIEHVSKIIGSLSIDDLKTIKADAEMLKIIKNFYPKAEYSLTNLGHYGLGLDAYAHATSPGRRYPDLFTQRLYYELMHTELTLAKIKKYEELTKQYVELFNFESKIQGDYHSDILTFTKK